MKEVKHTKTPCGAFGIKAYGTWECFMSREEYEAYLLDWICSTEGAERDRAVEATANLHRGIRFTDTDSGQRGSIEDFV